MTHTHTHKEEKICLHTFHLPFGVHSHINLPIQRCFGVTLTLEWIPHKTNSISSATSARNRTGLHHVGCKALDAETSPSFTLCGLPQGSVTRLVVPVRTSSPAGMLASSVQLMQKNHLQIGKQQPNHTKVKITGLW